MLCDFWAQSGKGRRTPTTLVVPCNIPYIFREMLLESQKNLQTWPQPMEFRLHTPQLPAGISVCPGARAKKERMKRLRVCSRGRFRMIQVDMFKSQIVSDTVEYAPPTLHFYLKSQGFGSQGQFEVPARTLGTHLVERTSWLHAGWFFFTVQQQSSRAPKTSKLEATVMALYQL